MSNDIKKYRKLLEDVESAKEELDESLGGELKLQFMKLKQKIEDIKTINELKRKHPFLIQAYRAFVTNQKLAFSERGGVDRIPEGANGYNMILNMHMSMKLLIQTMKNYGFEESHIDDEKQTWVYTCIDDKKNNQYEYMIVKIVLYRDDPDHFYFMWEQTNKFIDDENTINKLNNLKRFLY